MTTTAEQGVATEKPQLQNPSMFDPYVHGENTTLNLAAHAMAIEQTSITSHSANINATDHSYLQQQYVLDQRPDLSTMVPYVLGYFNVEMWQVLGIFLKVPLENLSEISFTYPSYDDKYLAVIMHWLDHNEAASWKTLLEVLGHFETKETLDLLKEEVLGTQDNAVRRLVVGGACWFVGIHLSIF